MAQSVRRVCTNNSTLDKEDCKEPTTTFSATSFKFLFGDTLEMQQLARCCAQIQELAPSANESTAASNNEKNGVSHLRVSKLIAQIEFLTSGRFKLPVPRFFFQQLQSTSIKLSVAPQPRVLGEPFSVPQGSQLALKVEGVLRHGKRASLYRSVSAICVTISITASSKTGFEKKVC